MKILNIHKMFLKFKGLLLLLKENNVYLVDQEIKKFPALNFLPVFLNKEEFSEKYKIFIKGLDEESLKKINKLLETYEKVLFNDIINYNKIYDEEDIKIIKETYKFACKNIKNDKNMIKVKLGYNTIKFIDSDFEIGVLLYNSNLKFVENVIGKEILNNYLKNKCSIIGGAYTGDSIFSILDYNFKAIHAFEPDERTYMKLQRNVELNKDLINKLGTKIYIYKKGLYNQSKKLKFKSFGLSSRIVEHDDYDYQIDVLKGDELFKNKKVGFITLDVEGSAFEAIQGLRETIKNNIPILNIAIYHNPKEFFEIKPLIESWDLKYKFFIKKSRGSPPAADTNLIAMPEKLFY